MGLTEKLLELCGYKIWPPTHGDPRIKGPQPRIISKRQKEWLEKLQMEQHGCCGADIAVYNDSVKRKGKDKDEH